MDEAAYRRSINNKENQKRQLEARNQALKDNLSRLKDARDQVKRLKDDYKDISRDVKKTVKGKHDWEGERYKKGKRMMEGIVTEDEYAVGAIDRALDTLEREIADTQNTIRGNDNLIKQLINAINTLWGELRALAN